MHRRNKKLRFDDVSISYLTLKNLKEHRDKAVRDLFGHLNKQDIEPVDRMCTEHARKVQEIEIVSFFQTFNAFIFPGGVDGRDLFHVT